MVVVEDFYNKHVLLIMGVMKWRRIDSGLDCEVDCERCYQTMIIA